MNPAPDAFDGDDRLGLAHAGRVSEPENHCPPKVEAKQERCYSSCGIGQDGTRVALTATPQRPNVGEAWEVART
jgi:hypothetical protein